MTLPEDPKQLAEAFAAMPPEYQAAFFAQWADIMWEKDADERWSVRATMSWDQRTNVTSLLKYPSE